MLYLFIIATIFCTLNLEGQSLTTDNPEKISLPGVERAFYPLLSPDGSSIVFSAENRNGLFLYSFDSDKVLSISNGRASGRNPVFSPDSNYLFYSEESSSKDDGDMVVRVYSLDNNRCLLDLPGSRVKAFEQSDYRKFIRSILNFNISSVFPDYKALKQGSFSYPYAATERGRLFYYEDCFNHRRLDPLNARAYLHANLSPCKNFIVAYAVGHGAFVTDLNGKVVAEFGHLEAPVWLSSGIVAGMITRDDGHFITGSSLQAVNFLSGNIYDLTGDESVLMYPSVSKSNKVIVAHSNSGEIFSINYQLNN
ncbi:hypothetical protein QA597_01760 [Marinilabiliaceae bacterium ANBcel2]|nr:hypothetical protein [Marinilabiliaceae bacterium ANBcel2]